MPGKIRTALKVDLEKEPLDQPYLHVSTLASVPLENEHELTALRIDGILIVRQIKSVQF